jgi:hypothetical protein
MLDQFHGTVHIEKPVSASKLGDHSAEVALERTTPRGHDHAVVDSVPHLRGIDREREVRELFTRQEGPVWIVVNMPIPVPVRDPLNVSQKRVGTIVGKPVQQIHDGGISLTPDNYVPML